MKGFYSVLVAAFAGALVWGCAGSSSSLSGVKGFQKERYLGRWYEIARFDFRFERNLKNTTADYGLMDDGRISVVNQGYNVKTLKWQKAEGKARFRGSDSVAELEVSFFGPFYAQYNVLALDSAYRYALVAGKNTDYLWILSRTPALPDSIRRQYLSIAHQNAFDTTRFLWVDHTPPNH